MFRTCKGCGQIAKIKGLGLCRACYRKHFRKTHLGYMRDLERRLGDRKRFGHDREEIAGRFGGKCICCGMTDDQSVAQWGRRLEIHHQDGHNGHSEVPNHTIENLALLCKTCHKAVHDEAKKGAVA